VEIGKLAQLVHTTRAWNEQLLGSESQRQRPHEAEDRFRGF